MSKEKAIKYIKAAQTAIDEVPYPCTTKAKLLLVDALKELEGDITKFNVVRYFGTYADGLIATCDTKEEAEKICEKYNKKHRCNFKYHYEVKIDDKKYLHIKSKQGYRPFKNAEECWKEMEKHQPFGWLKCKEGYFNIVYVDDYYVGFADKDNSSILLASKNSYQDNTFKDGTPFGVKVEEDYNGIK